MSKEGGRVGLFETERGTVGSKRGRKLYKKLISSKQASKSSRQGTRWLVVTFNFLIASFCAMLQEPHSSDDVVA